MHFLLLLAQNLPTELQVCPHPQTHQVGVFCGQNPGGLAVSQVKILLKPLQLQPVILESGQQQIMQSQGRQQQVRHLQNRQQQDGQ